MQQSSLFLGSTVSLAVLAQKLGPWLCTTKQGLWPQQLPLVKQTICLGWLLFWLQSFSWRNYGGQSSQTCRGSSHTMLLQNTEQLTRMGNTNGPTNESNSHWNGQHGSTEPPGVDRLVILGQNQGVPCEYKTVISYWDLQPSWWQSLPESQATGGRPSSPLPGNIWQNWTNFFS